jgi:hypothetical protein
LGTWAAGAFGNDHGLNYVGEVIDGLMDSIFAFIDQPRIDENFDQAFAALALLNIIDHKLTVPLPSSAEADVWKRVFLHTYDSQIDELHPDKTYKRSQRKAVEKELDRLVAACRERADGEDGRVLGRLGRLLMRARARRHGGPFTINYRELSDWATGFSDDLERAWTSCPRGDWLIALATALGVPMQELVLAVAALFSPLLSKVPEGEQRPAEALRVAERWARGQATGADCVRAWEEARAAAGVLPPVAGAFARATAALAEAAAEAAMGRDPMARDALTDAVKESTHVVQQETLLATQAAGKTLREETYEVSFRAQAAALEAAAPRLRERIPFASVREAFLRPPVKT